MSAASRVGNVLERLLQRGQAAAASGNGPISSSSSSSLLRRRQPVVRGGNPRRQQQGWGKTHQGGGAVAPASRRHAPQQHHREQHSAQHSRAASFPSSQEYIRMLQRAVSNAPETISSSIHAPLLQTIKNAIQLEERLADGKHIVDHLFHGGQLRGFPMLLLGDDVDRGAGSVVVVGNNYGPGLELRCGISGRWSTAEHLGSSSSSSRRRFRARLVRPSDFQFSEILPNGRVVTLTKVSTSVSLHDISVSMRKILHDGEEKKSQKNKKNTTTTRSNPETEQVSAAVAAVNCESHAEQCHPSLSSSLSSSTATATATATAKPTTVYVHFIIHKTEMSLEDAFTALQAQLASLEGCGGVPQHHRFDVNVVLDDQFVTSQTMSVSIDIPTTTTTTTTTATSTLSHTEDNVATVANCDAAAVARVHRVVDALIRVNLKASPVKVQFIGVRRFPCSLHLASQCRVRCVGLLRGVDARPATARNALRGALRLSPNFFGPRRFYYGIPSQRFWWYHVSEAVQRGAFRVALAMLVHSEIQRAQATGGKGEQLVGAIHGCFRTTSSSGSGDGATTVSAPRWIQEFATRVKEGEEHHESAYRIIFFNLVPEPIRRLVMQSRDALIWNTVLSCRLRLARCGGRRRDDHHNLGREEREEQQEATTNGTDDGGDDSDTMMSHGEGLIQVNDVVGIDPDVLMGKDVAGRQEEEEEDAPRKSDATVGAMEGDHPPAAQQDEAIRALVEEFSSITSDDGANTAGGGAARDLPKKTKQQQRLLRAQDTFHRVASSVTTDVKWELAPSSAACPPYEQFAELWRRTGGHKTPPPSRDDVIARSVSVVSTPDMAMTAPSSSLLLPLDASSSSDTRLVNSILGFSNSTRRSPPLYLRNAFVSCSNSSDAVSRNTPTSSVIVRTISDVSAVSDSPVEQGNDEGGGGDASSTMITLATDLELTGTARTEFTSKSRGESQPLWPIGRSGHSLASRLPVGALSDTNDRNTTKSIVVQCDVPSTSYLSSMLRECCQLQRGGTMSRLWRRGATMTTTTTTSSSSTSTTSSSGRHTTPPQRKVAVDNADGDDSSNRTDYASDGNIMGLKVRGISLKEAVLQGVIGDELTTGRSVPRDIRKQEKQKKK